MDDRLQQYPNTCLKHFGHKRCRFFSQENKTAVAKDFTVENKSVGSCGSFLTIFFFLRKGQIQLGAMKTVSGDHYSLTEIRTLGKVSGDIFLERLSVFLKRLSREDAFPWIVSSGIKN